MKLHPLQSNFYTILDLSSHEKADFNGRKQIFNFSVLNTVFFCGGDIPNLRDDE